MSKTDDMHARHHDALDREGTSWMAAAGAAIGFALHEASSVQWSVALALTGGAVVMWCASFAAGMFRAAAHRHSMRQNLVALMAADMGASHDDLAPVRISFEERSTAQVRWRSAQLWCLFAGAILYLAASLANAQQRTDPAADRRCLALQRDMLSAHPRKSDGPALFQAFGCRPQGEGSVMVPPTGAEPVIQPKRQN
jgi:hypothetical protein